MPSSASKTCFGFTIFRSRKRQSKSLDELHNTPAFDKNNIPPQDLMQAMLQQADMRKTMGQHVSNRRSLIHHEISDKIVIMDPAVQLSAFIEAERQFVKLQQSGEHDSAVRCLEVVLKENQEFVTQLQDTLLSSLFEKLAVGYNTLGMKYLKLGKTSLSLKYFQKAEAVTDPANMHMHQGPRLVLRAVTYNNLGCFYKSMNKLHTSLQYLKKALVIEERALAQDVTNKDRNGNRTFAQNPAATHLNLCALLSQMNMHEKALYHAQRAIKFLEFDTAESSVKGESLTSVAFFNLGAEYEHLKLFNEALQSYETAYATCIDELGTSHALSSKIAGSVQQLRKKLRVSGAGKVHSTNQATAG